MVIQCNTVAYNTIVQRSADKSFKLSGYTLSRKFRIWRDVCRAPVGLVALGTSLNGTYLCHWRSCCRTTLCLRKTRKLWNGIAQNYKLSIDFDDIWQKYSKYSRIEFACFSFCVGLLFLSTFRLSNRTPNITQILKITPHTACQHGAIQ